jgi:hypothetical protein
MTITCERLDDLLFEGDPASMAAAEEHGRTCEACRASLDAWKAISATAPTLREEWESDLLLPRVMRAIRDDRARSTGGRFWQIAAVLLLTALLGGATTWVVRDRARDAEFDRAILRIAAVEEVERAQRSHVAAIEQLEAAAETKLEASDDPLMISYNEKLMMLDEAIAECERAIEQNRQNAHLRKQLLAMLDQKQATLRAVMREDTNVPAN